MQWLAVLLALCVACGGEKTTKPSGGSAGSAQPTPPPPASNDVKIFVDDVVVTTVAEAQVKLWPRVDTIVPVAARRLGTWQAIKLTSGKPQAVEINQPSAAHPELVPALFPGEGGKPAFGMFDPVELAKHGNPTLRENMVTEVRIMLAKGTGRGQNEHGDNAGGDPALLKLTIKTAKGEQVIEGKKLLEMTREAPPGDADGKGWKLSTVLAQAGVTKYERLLLADAKNTNLTLEKQDLDEKSAIPFIKLNRQGTLRFRVYRKQGDTWQPGSDLRALERIEVLK